MNHPHCSMRALDASATPRTPPSVGPVPVPGLTHRARAFAVCPHAVTILGAILLRSSTPPPVHHPYHQHAPYPRSFTSSPRTTTCACSTCCSCSPSPPPRSSLPRSPSCRSCGPRLGSRPPCTLDPEFITRSDSGYFSEMHTRRERGFSCGLGEILQDWSRIAHFTRTLFLTPCSLFPSLYLIDFTFQNGHVFISIGVI
jgi:hypothetical protein